MIFKLADSFQEAACGKQGDEILQLERVVYVWLKVGAKLAVVVRKPVTLFVVVVHQNHELVRALLLLFHLTQQDKLIVSRTHGCGHLVAAQWITLDRNSDLVAVPRPEQAKDSSYLRLEPTLWLKPKRLHEVVILLDDFAFFGPRHRNIPAKRVASLREVGLRPKLRRFKLILSLLATVDPMSLRSVGSFSAAVSLESSKVCILLIQESRFRVSLVL